MKPVPFKTLTYRDVTGYATHLHVELYQYIDRQIRVASYCLPVVGGRATLNDPPVEQVFRFEIQPVMSVSPGKDEPLTAPLTYRSPGGLFVSDAIVLTSGNLVVTTKLYAVQAAPGPDPIAVLNEEWMAAVGGFQFEASFNEFNYFDELDGDAETVQVLINGIRNGVQRAWRETRDIGHDNNSEPLEYTYEDVTRIEFQPKRSDGTDYGNAVVRTRTPGFFLINVSGKSSGDAGDPTNTASQVEAQPLPFPSDPSASFEVLQPGTKTKKGEERRSKSEGKQRSGRKGHRSKH